MNLSAIEQWLLEGDASIRWQTMRDLAGLPPDEYAPVRDSIATTGWGMRLLDMQDPEGTWAQTLYAKKWISTTYTLLLLYRLGLPGDNAAALRGVEHLWDGATYLDGGLTCAKTIPTPEGCVTAMYVLLAEYFGFDDPRVEDAINWMIRDQRDDGGWNCRYARHGDTHGSFHTSITTLEALAEVQREGNGDPAIDNAMDRAREFFLDHRMYQSHRTGEVANPAFTRLSFPPRWHYDILRGLDHFQAVNAPWDDRFSDALDLLNGKRLADGRWPLQQRYGGKRWFAMEQLSDPSRWNTLRALRVLRWAGRGDESLLPR